MIPEPKPRGIHREHDGGATYVCAVRGCGFNFTSDTKAQVTRRAEAHRKQHRSALTSDGGPQTTVFDFLDQSSPSTQEHQ